VGKCTSGEQGKTTVSSPAPGKPPGAPPGKPPDGEAATVEFFCMLGILFLFILFFRSFLRRIEPFDGLVTVDSSFQLRLVGRLKSVWQFLVAEGVAEIVSVRFKTILRTDTSSCSLVLSWKKKRKKVSIL
jgi:hypothetical protein